MTKPKSGYDKTEAPAFLQDTIPDEEKKKYEHPKNNRVKDSPNNNHWIALHKAAGFWDSAKQAIYYLRSVTKPEDLEAIMDKMIQLGKEGDKAAARFVFEYLFGRPQVHV